MNIIQESVKTALLASIICLALILLTLYQPLVHYKFHFSAVVEMHQATDQGSIAAVTKAKITQLKNEDLTKYRQDIADKFNVQLPPTLLLEFYDRPSIIKKELALIIANPEVINVLYNKNMLNATQNICYIIQEIANIVTIFLTLLSILIAIASVFNNKVQSSDEVLQTVKMVSIELSLATILAISATITLVKYIGTLINLQDPFFTLHINYLSLVLYALLCVMAIAILQLISIKATQNG